MDRMIETDSGAQPLRYVSAAVAVHWITAALVLAQIAIGLKFGDMPKGPARLELFTWHKTVGVTILLLAVVRLAIRLSNPPPPFPADFPKWERFAAVWTHRIFYFMLFALPLTGLAAISAHATGPTTPLIGGIPFPVIPGVGEKLGETLGGIHGLLVWTTIALLVLHIGAALKQQFIDRTLVADRMPSFRSTRR